MQELALAGAKVLNAQAVEFARDRGITIHARSTFAPGPGTRVSKSGVRELRVSGVALDAEILVVRGPAEKLRNALQAHSAWPREMWDDRAVVPLENVHGLPALLEELRGFATVEDGLAQVAVVGNGIGSSKEPLDRALKAAGVEPRGVLVAPLRIALLVPRAEAKDVVRRLHAEFIERV
jgi:aspartate kinase